MKKAAINGHLFHRCSSVPHRWLKNDFSPYHLRRLRRFRFTDVASDYFCAPRDRSGYHAAGSPCRSRKENLTPTPIGEFALQSPELPLLRTENINAALIAARCGRDGSDRLLAKNALPALR